MATYISTPPTLKGDEANQIAQLWSYLYEMAEVHNVNLDAQDVVNATITKSSSSSST